MANKARRLNSSKHLLRGHALRAAFGRLTFSKHVLQEVEAKAERGGEMLQIASDNVKGQSKPEAVSKPQKTTAHACQSGNRRDLQAVHDKSKSEVRLFIFVYAGGRLQNFCPFWNRATKGIFPAFHDS